MPVYEIKCTPPNEASRVVSLTAASVEEAMQSANNIWCRQMHAPILLAIVSDEKQVALAF